MARGDNHIERIFNDVWDKINNLLKVSIFGTVPLPTGASTEAKQDVVIANQTNKTQTTQITDGTNEVVVNSDGSLNMVGSIGLSVPLHDYEDLTYTDGLVTSIVYKTGGSGGTTVGTKTITYNPDNTIATMAVT